jgi:hypothetical protein
MAVKTPQEAVLTIYPVTGYYVNLDSRIGYQRNDPREVFNMKLIVSVGVEHEVFFGCLETTLQRRAITEVFLMTDQFHAWVCISKFAHNLCCVVATAVINDYHLKVVRYVRQKRQCFFEEGRDIVLFVVAGKENAERYFAAC